MMKWDTNIKEAKLRDNERIKEVTFSREWLLKVNFRVVKAKHESEYKIEFEKEKKSRTCSVFQKQGRPIGRNIKIELNITLHIRVPN